MVKFFTANNGVWTGNKGKDSGFGDEPYYERTTFQVIPKTVQNPAIPKIYFQNIYGVQYHTKLYKTSKMEIQIHDECGYLLFAFDDFITKNGTVHVFRPVSVVRGMTLMCGGSFTYRKKKQPFFLRLHKYISKIFKKKFKRMFFLWQG